MRCRLAVAGSEVSEGEGRGRPVPVAVEGARSLRDTGAPCGAVQGMIFGPETIEDCSRVGCFGAGYLASPLPPQGASDRVLGFLGRHAAYRWPFAEPVTIRAFLNNPADYQPRRIGT